MGISPNDYSLFLKKFLEGMSKIKGVFLGFNTNIDAIVHLEKNVSLLESLFETCEDVPQFLPEKINTLGDLKRWLIEGVKNGKSAEVITWNSEIQDFFMKHAKDFEMCVGGPPGIVGNILTRFSIDVIIHVPSRSKRQIEVLEKSLKIIEDGKIQKISAKECDKDLIHWILEYPRGFSINACGDVYSAPRENRLIVSYDDLNTRFYIDPEYLENVDLLSKNVSHAIISGHHLLTPETNYREALKRGEEFIKTLKEGGVKTHTEIAYTAYKDVRKEISKRILSNVNSIGINEVELGLFLSEYDNSLGESILKNITYENITHALALLIEKTSVDRVQFHTYGLYIEAVRKDGIYGKTSSECLMVASAFAAIKAHYGDIHPEKCLVPTNVFVYDKYVDLAKKISTTIIDDVFFAAIPTLIVPNPRSTVGLGDTISTFGFLAREVFR
ncbi:MAG TPA: hypothetical protein ENI59_01155 [Euryarchaeota archaeon]|nr:hypothetical protein [Euryarchaeota archaeon]